MSIERTIGTFAAAVAMRSTLYGAAYTFCARSRAYTRIFDAELNFDLIKLVPCSQGNGTTGKIPPPRLSPRSFGRPLSTHRSANHTHFQNLIHSQLIALQCCNSNLLSVFLGEVDKRLELQHCRAIKCCVCWCS